jgi:HD-GYP domain-containing protein (c-di-GMP phosphodiesterase class II)
METIVLDYPVSTLEGDLILEAGTDLTLETISKVSASTKETRRKRYPLLGHGRVREDLTGFLTSPPYSTIFAGPEPLMSLESLASRVELIRPALDALDHFLEHDFYTYQHILVVYALGSLLSRQLVGTNKEVEVAAAGPTHDIGKICVPLEVLRKETPLTEKERKHLHHHAAAGFVLLEYFQGGRFSFDSRVARDHHERRDGSGYPRGVRIKDRLVEVITVCDVYDALISPRPYRLESFDNRTALEELTDMAEAGKIGWDALKALIANNRRDKPSYKDIQISKERRGTAPDKNFYGVSSDDEPS